MVEYNVGMMNSPQTGARAAVELIVRPEHLAAEAPVYADLKPALPRVMSTVTMVSLMEKAAALVLAPFLDAHETSVGITVEVTHEAATAEGGTVRAEAVLKAIDGTKFLFEVIARDQGGIVGKGSHKRAIVSRGKLEAAAAERGRTETA